MAALEGQPDPSGRDPWDPVNSGRRGRSAVYHRDPVRTIPALKPITPDTRDLIVVKPADWLHERDDIEALFLHQIHFEPARSQAFIQIPRGLKISIVGFNQRGSRVRSIRAIRLAAEAVKGRQSAQRSDVKDRTVTGSAAVQRRPIKISVQTLHQGAVRELAVSAIGFAAEAIHRRQCSTRIDFENGAVILGSAIQRRPVKIPIGTLHKGAVGAHAIAAIGLITEAVQCGERAVRSNFEHRSLVVHYLPRSPTECRAVEIAVGALNQRGIRI